MQHRRSVIETFKVVHPPPLNAPKITVDEMTPYFLVRINSVIYMFIYNLFLYIDSVSQAYLPREHNWRLQAGGVPMHCSNVAVATLEQCIGTPPANADSCIKKTHFVYHYWGYYLKKINTDNFSDREIWVFGRFLAENRRFFTRIFPPLF